jgi:1-acyl-sn-glycerol-3-phosphate acyltransferase
VLRLIARISVRGQANVPPTGAVLIAMNHCSLWDGPLLCSLSKRPVACLVKAEAFKPGIGNLLRAAGQIPVHRFVVDPAPIHRGLAILRSGGVLGIFPEGTRGAGDVRYAYPGVGYLAMRSGATVIPVIARGTATLASRWRRSRVVVEVGAPIVFDRFPDLRPLNRQQVLAATEVIRQAMVALAADTAPAGTAAGANAARLEQ